MIELPKYNEDKIEFPSVVDVIDFQNHLVLDVIQLVGETLKKQQELLYNNQKCLVEKILRNHPLKTEQNINREGIRRVRYFCKKVF